MFSLNISSIYIDSVGSGIPHTQVLRKDAAHVAYKNTYGQKNLWRVVTVAKDLSTNQQTMRVGQLLSGAQSDTVYGYSIHSSHIGFLYS